MASGHTPPSLSGLDKIELDALEQESVRQELEDYLESLREREKGIKVLEEAQQFLEDQLEDANTEIDRLQQELDKLAVQLEETRFLYQESETARKELEQTLFQMREGVDVNKLTDLRDQRMQQSAKVLGFDALTRGPFIKGLLLGILIASILTILGLEIFSFVHGRGELFTLLLGG